MGSRGVGAEHWWQRLSPLEWFFHAVQVAMLGASIPNVTEFFAAYERASMSNGGVSISGLFTIGDLRNAFVGIMIDASVLVASIAAVRQYQRTRRAWTLWPHFLMMFVFGGISFVANWETVTINASHSAYQGFTAWGFLMAGANTLIAASPPLLCVLMVILTPSIAAKEVIKSPEEIAAENASNIALIQAQNEAKAARIRSEALVAEAEGVKRQAQAVGWVKAGRAGVAAAIAREGQPQGQPQGQPSAQGSVTGATTGATKALTPRGRDPQDGSDDDDRGPQGPGGGGLPSSPDHSTRGAHKWEDDGWDAFRTQGEVPAVKANGHRNSANNRADTSSPSASMVTRAAHGLPAIEYVRRYHEIGVNELAEVLGAGQSTMQNLLSKYPETKAQDARGAKRFAAPVMPLIAWLQDDDQSPEYRDYGFRLEKLVADASAPKARGAGKGSKGRSSSRNEKRPGASAVRRALRESEQLEEAAALSGTMTRGMRPALVSLAGGRTAAQPQTDAEDTSFVSASNS